MKHIFTFWEPESAIPGYLKLCMRTWRTFLPEYEIVVLNYANLEQWLGKDYYPNDLYTNFSLPKQADAVRCAVLRRWGGVWLDTDTVVTSSQIRDLLRPEAEVILLDRHIAFIVAQKDAKVLSLWERGIRLHIALYACCRGRSRLAGTLRAHLESYLERWDVLGNLPLGVPLKLAEMLSAAAFKSINKRSIQAFPELSLEHGTVIEKYLKYYFSDAPIDHAMQGNGILCLHNSWTPDAYRRMHEEEFLSQNIVLAKILRHILLQ